MISPNKKTYDELTSIMFQLYNGNDYGMGNFSSQFLDKTERAWRQGRKKLQKTWVCLWLRMYSHGLTYPYHCPFQNWWLCRWQFSTSY